MKEEIITMNCYNFKQWFEKVDPKMQEKMIDFFNNGDPRNKIIKKVIRKEKLKRVYGKGHIL